MELLNSGKVFLFFILLTLLLPLSSAVLLSAPPPEKLTYDFEPNLEITGSMSIKRGSPGALTLYVEGDLKEYIKLDKETLSYETGSEWVPFSYTIKLPASIKEPGKHAITIGAIEGEASTVESSGVGARVAVEHPITILVPYPNQYIKAELNTKIASGHVDFILTLNNLGHEDLSDISSKLAVFGSSGGKAKEKDFPSVSKLATETKKNVTLSIPEDEFSPDKYSAKAFVSYGDGKESVADSNFTIEEKVFGVAESEFDQDYMPLIWVITGTAILMSLFLGLQYWKRKKKGRK